VFEPIVIQSSVTLTDFTHQEKKWWYRGIDHPILADHEPLRHTLGIHKECGKTMCFYRVKATHSIIECLTCQIRILIPPSVGTYQELRAYAKTQEPQA